MAATAVSTEKAGREKKKKKKRKGGRRNIDLFLPRKRGERGGGRKKNAAPLLSRR